MRYRKPKTVEELVNHAMNIIDKVIKNLEIHLKVELKVMEGPKPTTENTYSGYFLGYPTSISNSVIQLYMYHYNILSGNAKLRRWNAGVVILFLHEYSHYLIFKKLGVQQRKEAIRKYSTYKYYEEKEETEAWNLTVKLLKKLNYHTRKTIIQELDKFDFPEGFKPKF